MIPLRQSPGMQFDQLQSVCIAGYCLNFNFKQIKQISHYNYFDDDVQSQMKYANLCRQRRGTRGIFEFVYSAHGFFSGNLAGCCVL